MRYPSDLEYPVATHMKEGFDSGKAIVALKRAIEATFDDVRWQELGYLLGEHDLIVDHPRLLRSLHWSDNDYGGHVFDVVRQLLGKKLQNLQRIEEFVGLEEWLRRKDPPLYTELYDEAGIAESVISLEQVEDTSNIHDVVELNRHAGRIRRGIVEDPEQAIGSAKDLLESVLKTVIGDHSQKPVDNIPDLLKKAQIALDLDPKAVAEALPGAATLKRTLSNLGLVVIGVAELRTLYGTGHGRSKSRELEIAHARLVVNAAISVATFMLEVWQDREVRS